MTHSGNRKLQKKKQIKEVIAENELHEAGDFSVTENLLGAAATHSGDRKIQKKNKGSCHKE